MKIWSKLQRQLYLLIDPNINFQIHCSIYRMDSQRGCTDLPRYWISLGKEIIFDYPKQFIKSDSPYPYLTDVSAISEMLREYIDTPLNLLPDKHFEKDEWGITEILKCADRRISVARIETYFTAKDNEILSKILQARKANKSSAPKAEKASSQKTSRTSSSNN